MAFLRLLLEKAVRLGVLYYNLIICYINITMLFYFLTCIKQVKAKLLKKYFAVRNLLHCYREFVFVAAVYAVRVFIDFAVFVVTDSFHSQNRRVHPNVEHLGYSLIG